jgi:hypothetical protein
MPLLTLKTALASWTRGIVNRPEFSARAEREWWIYEGTVPLDRITGLEIIHGRNPWWLESAG